MLKFKSPIKHHNLTKVTYTGQTVKDLSWKLYYSTLAGAPKSPQF